MKGEWKLKLFARSVSAAIIGHLVMDLWAWIFHTHHYPFYSLYWWGRTFWLAVGIFIFFEIELWSQNGNRPSPP